MRRTFAVAVSLASLAAACSTPEPQIIWPEPLGHPSPYSHGSATTIELDPQAERRAELVRAMHVCHPWHAAVLSFAPGEVWPENREPKVAELRERVESWCELDARLHHPDEDPAVAVGRAEAMERLAFEAGIEPSMLASDIQVAEADELDHAHAAVLLAVSELSCLL
jgi:hypothetical protein